MMNISSGGGDKNGTFFYRVLVRMLILKGKYLQKELPNLDLLSLGCWDEGRREGGMEGRREKREHTVGTAECTLRTGQSYAR